MDNFTLIAALNIVLAINIIFTIIMRRNRGEYGLKEWRISTLFLFSGFILLLMQNVLNQLISYCIANYLILLGFYYQVSAAVIFEYRIKKINRLFLPLISLIFWGLFIYYTFVQFNTPIRIIVISALFVFIYIYGSILTGKLFLKGNKSLHTLELLLLFIFSALFYSLRIAVTADGMGAVRSIYDRNLPTTLTFTYVIIFNLIYHYGMLNAFLRKRNNLIISEKNKLNHLFDFLNDTAKHLDIEELFKSIEDVLRKSLGVNAAAIFLSDNEKTETLKVAYGFNDLDLPQDLVVEVKKGEGAAGRAFEFDEVVEIDIDSYPDRKIADSYKSKGVTSLLSSPLKTSEGIIGAFTVVNTGHLKKDIIDRSFLYYLGEQIGLVLYNAFLFEKVTQLANVDPLTGLFNRRKMLELFELEIKRSRRSRKPFTIAMADIDNFKSVNDIYGHECGDEVLKSISEILRKECRESDYICRWGGEEFLLLFIDTNLSTAKDVADRILLVFENKKNICMNNFTTTLSMGITEFSADLSIEQILKNADDALYKAKKNGKNRVEAV